MAQSTSAETSDPFHTESSANPGRLDASLPNTRRPYHREQSWTLPKSKYQQIDQNDRSFDQAEESGVPLEPRGLGLSDVALHSEASPEIERVPVGSRGYSTISDSPRFGTFSQATTAQNTGNVEQAGKWTTPQSSRYSLQEPSYQHSPSNLDLLPHNNNHQGCPTRGDILKTQWTGFTLMIVLLAVYSTLFSAIFLVVALARPRWGYRIGPRGALSYDSATLLSALFSKTVELTFATTFVATLGQVLTRRAFARSRFSRQNRGISIAEMNMRLWIMQPGTLFTHWTGAKYAVPTPLGVAALIAAFATSFYTTAAESLVSPKLKFGKNETLTMFGEVSASYANPLYLSETCSTPITKEMDPENAGTTCLQIDLAGNGFRTLDSWLAVWQDRAKSNEDMPTLSAAPRPVPVAVLYENTTVTGQWIDRFDQTITTDSEKYGRLLQNVTLAMPHANVFHATRSSKNRILQPDDLEGAGEYYVKAAVPVPGLNVLCAGATAEELTPLILTSQNGTAPPEWPITTVFDEIFDWTEEPTADEVGWEAPCFPKLPSEYNTLVNSTGAYGTEAVYLLGRPPSTTVTSEYVLCAVRSFTYSDCSTAYHVAQSGGQLSVHCGNDTENWKSYWKIAKDNEEPFPSVLRSKDWKNVGSEWIKAVALSAGNADTNASSSRLMTQLIPSWTNGTKTQLSPIQPSIAEALGVLASYTLLLSSDASQFVHWWDYAKQALEQPATASFDAILSYKDYASGGDKNWKYIFYPILAAVFFQNCFCLAYLLWTFCRDGELTDYTEPQNLFALAVNSPSSRTLAGACGGGPEGEVLGKKWCVDMSLTDTNPQNSTYTYGHNSHNNTLSHPHFYVRYPDEDSSAYTSSAQTSSPSMWGSAKSPSKHVSWTPLLDMKWRSRTHTARPKSMQDLDNLDANESPAAAQYRRLVQ